MTVYFNKNKEAHAYEILEPLATVDYDTWMKYSEMEVGVGWDIVDGVFTPLLSTEEIQFERHLPIRESERHELYTIADEQIAKCDNHTLLDIEAEHYTRLKIQWLQYKMDVRRTQEQEGFPFEVTYPTRPDEDDNDENRTNHRL